MRRSLPIATALLLLLAAGGAQAGAGANPDTPTADTPTRWDDRHMRSNFAHQRGPAPPRPPVQGADRYRTATEHPAPTPPTGVAETILRISPHGWSPGGASAHTGATPPWADSRGGMRSNARPTASAGVRSGSSVRSGARSAVGSRARR